MLVIPDYLIYDELKRREERDIDGGLVPLHLPLYEPELEETAEDWRDEDDAPSRGVIIMDMNSGFEVSD